MAQAPKPKEDKPLKSWSVLLITGNTLTRVAQSLHTSMSGLAFKDAAGDVLWHYGFEDVIDVAPADFVFDYSRRELLNTRRQMKGLQPLAAVPEKPSTVTPITSESTKRPEGWKLQQQWDGEIRFNVSGQEEAVPFDEQAAEAEKCRRERPDIGETLAAIRARRARSSP